eukprot:3934094-Rhodomonas_salina.2
MLPEPLSDQQRHRVLHLVLIQCRSQVGSLHLVADDLGSAEVQQQEEQETRDADGIDEDADDRPPDGELVGIDGRTHGVDVRLEPLAIDAQIRAGEGLEDNSRGEVVGQEEEEERAVEEVVEPRVERRDPKEEDDDGHDKRRDQEFPLEGQHGKDAREPCNARTIWVRRTYS